MDPLAIILRLPNTYCFKASFKSLCFSVTNFEPDEIEWVNKQKLQ